MNLKFKFYLKGQDFSQSILGKITEIDKRTKTVVDIHGKYQELEISSHMLNFPDEFLPRKIRKLIQAEITKIVVESSEILCTTEYLGVINYFQIGSVSISMASSRSMYKDLYLVGTNIHGMIRALIMVSKLQSGILDYQTPGGLASNKILESNKVKFLKKSLDESNREYAYLSKSNLKKVEALNEEISKLKNNFILKMWNYFF